MKKISVFTLILIVSSLLAVSFYHKKETKQISYTGNKIEQSDPLALSKFANIPAKQYNKAAVQGGLDFTAAAEVATPAVVHIKTMQSKQTVSQKQQQPNILDFFNDPFFDFFGDPYGGRGNPDQNYRGREGSGSGVIISSDGYIVSNNHVVSAGDLIEVVLSNNKTYDAEVVGTDPSTDIALIKIQETDLPYLQFSDSDQVKVGEWVLAVGNPFNLASTVTAGIVSAKARNINILKEKSAIESFIQTDAAVNPGNSGGALVDLSGELIGINTAIATPTGTFAGYSFAVPSNLVEKVVYDLREYGVVQRAYIGVNIRDLAQIDKETKAKNNINLSEGVFVSDVVAGSGAKDAGLQKGDVIIQVNNKMVTSAPQLQEAVASFRPGDEVGVTYVRNGKENFTEVELKNANLNTKEVTKDLLRTKYIPSLGAELKVISDAAKNQLELDGGLQVTRLGNGLLTKTTDIVEDFIIVRIDRKQIYTIADVERILEGLRGRGVMIEGVYPDDPNKIVYYAIGI